MKTLVQKILFFKIKWVFLGDFPFDVDGCHSVVHLRSTCDQEIDGFSRIQTNTALLDLTQEEDIIWKSINKKTRRDIVKARNEGVRIEINTRVDDFLTMMNKFQRRKGFRVFYLPDKKTIQQHGTLFTAVYDGEVLAADLCLEDDKGILDWLGCSKRLENTRFSQALLGHASRLIFWEIIRYAKLKGLKVFDFGGLWREDEIDNNEVKYNMNKYKLNFGGITEVRYTYRKTYSSLFKIGQNFQNIFFYKLLRQPRPD